MTRTVKKIGLIVWQVALISLFYWIGNLISKSLHLPIPGSVVGLVFLFLLLKLKVVRLQWFEKGANFLLAEMLLFFIPPAVGIVQYKQLMVTDGARIFVVILLSTITVMAGSGLFADLLSKKRGGESNEQRVGSR